MQIVLTNSRVRVRDAAEAMFSKRGYSAVGLQGIADAIQIQHLTGLLKR